MIYKYMGSTPGQGMGMSSYSNYLIFLGIDVDQVEVGVGASKWDTVDKVLSLKGLFKTTYVNITK